MPITSERRKRELTLGELVAGVYDLYGGDRGRGMVWLAFKLRLIKFRKPARLTLF